MKQLLIVSTFAEVNFLPDLFRDFNPPVTGKVISLYQDSDTSLDLLISGIGMPSTIFHLTRAQLINQYHRIIQMGLCGSFNPVYAPGQLVWVKEDRFADLGIDDRGLFKTLEEGLPGKLGSDPWLSEWISGAAPEDSSVTGVRGITVNTATGSEKRIKQLINQFHPDIETMEGAAALYIGRQLHVSVVQIRTVSNYVTQRDRTSWNISLARKSLFGWFKENLKP
ncbi:MAG: hypothetical protein J7L89_01025 [Bacteroidales bacterium]|nr:hypothetical protein [Bacteroidales bacterium]